MTSVETEPPSRIRLMEYYLRCGNSDNDDELRKFQSGRAPAKPKARDQVMDC